MQCRLAIVILNYRTPHLVVDCLQSVVDQLDASHDRCIVVDNASGDNSADMIEDAVRAHGWSDRVQVIRSDVNGGFAAGNNIGLQSVDAAWYLLLNSDTIVRDGAIGALLEAAASEPATTGLIGPRLEWPDGTPQESCFRYRSPRKELVRAAGTSIVTTIAGGTVGLGVSEQRMTGEWLSFAAVLIRRAVVEQVGLLDERYFMYFEDIDYCRRARTAGWEVVHEPVARIVHLRGGTSPVKKSSAARARMPRYFYESRSRYFATYYGRPGLWAANVLWWIGATITRVRAFVGRRGHHLCAREGRDNWIHAFQRPEPWPPGRAADRQARAAQVPEPVLNGGEA